MIRWQNLRRNLCPQCSSHLVASVMGSMILCARCPFKISDTKMEHVISVMAQKGPRLVDGWERFPDRSPQGGGENDPEPRE